MTGAELSPTVISAPHAGPLFLRRVKDLVRRPPTPRRATVEEAVTLATLVYALVAQATASIDRGEAAPSVDQELLRAASWRAARDGLAGHGIDLGSAQLVPAVDLIRRLLAQLRPDLEELDVYRSVHDALAVTLGRGNGAIRQRRILESGVPSPRWLPTRRGAP